MPAIGTYGCQNRALWISAHAAFLVLLTLLTWSASPALAIPTIQTSRAPIHDHQRLGAALVAHRGAGREAGAVAGDFDVFFVVGGRRDGAVPIPAFPRWGGGRSSGYVRVFF